MATIFEQENQRTPITYESCSRLGMRYIDTLDPQFVYQVEGKTWVETFQRLFPVYHDQIRVIFRLMTGTVEVRYTLDAGWDSERTWGNLPNPCEEDLVVLIEAVRQKFEVK
jgi:hypothetical protein